MKQPVTIGQLLSSIVAVLLAVSGALITMRTEVANLKQSQEQDEKFKVEIKDKERQNEIKRDAERQQSQQQREEMLRLLYEIKLEMKDKKNK